MLFRSAVPSGLCLPSARPRRTALYPPPYSGCCFPAAKRPYIEAQEAVSIFSYVSSSSHPNIFMLVSLLSLYNIAEERTRILSLISSCTLLVKQYWYQPKLSYIRPLLSDMLSRIKSLELFRIINPIIPVIKRFSVLCNLFIPA